MTVKDVIEEWLKKIAAAESMPQDIVAVNIGMFESDNGYGVYLRGFKEYDGEDDDWTCKPEYEPREKYLMLAGRGFESMVWETLLHQMILALKEILESGCESVRHFFDGRIVTAGFDEDKLFRVK